MPQDIAPTIPTEVIPPGLFPSTWPQEDLERRESLKQILFLVFKWRWLIFSLPPFFALVAAISLSLKPPVHTATTKILFKADRVPLQMSDLSTNKTPYSLQLLESEVELLKSRGVLLPAAKKILTLGSIEEGLSEEEIEAKVLLLAERLTAISVPDTNVIQVSYSAPAEEEAVRDLSAMLEEYQEQHARAHSGSTELLTFYEQERNRAEVALKEAEEQLAKWQATTNIVSIDDQIKGLLAMKADQETALQRNETEMVRSRDRDTLISRLKGDVVAADVALQDLLQRYTDEDRRVQEKKEQLVLLKQELAAAERNLQTSLVAERDTLRKQIHDTTASLTVLREKKLEFSRLSRLVNLYQETFLLYGKKVEEARIATGLDREQLSNIATIEQPYASPETDLKRRIATVVLAGIVGLILALASAIGLSLFSSSVRMEEDVEHYLKLPVLAVIPDLQRSVSP